MLLSQPIRALPAMAGQPLLGKQQAGRRVTSSSEKRIGGPGLVQLVRRAAGLLPVTAPSA